MHVIVHSDKFNSQFFKCIVVSFLHFPSHKSELLNKFSMMTPSFSQICEIFLHVVGVSHMKFPRSLERTVFRLKVLIFHVCLLIFSTTFALNSFHKNRFEKLSESYSRVFIFCVLGLTAFSILFQAWACRDLDLEVEENLKKVDEILNDGWKKKILKKKENCLKFCLKLLSKLIFQVLPVFVCISLSFIPLFLGNKVEFYDTLFYSILMIKLTSFHYAMTVGKLCNFFAEINKELKELLQYEEKIDFNLRKFTHFVENRMILTKFSSKVEKFIKCHEILFESVKILNKRFGISTFLITFSSFLCILNCGFNFFIEIETTQNKFVIISECFVELLKLLLSISLFRKPLRTRGIFHKSRHNLHFLSTLLESGE